VTASWMAITDWKNWIGTSSSTRPPGRRSG
jgi:hypothetical protein